MEKTVETVTEVKEVVDTAVNVAGPTIFKTSKTSKIVAGTVIGGIVVFGIVKGVNWLKDRKAAKTVVEATEEIVGAVEEDVVES